MDSLRSPIRIFLLFVGIAFVIGSLAFNLQYLDTGTEELPPAPNVGRDVSTEGAPPPPLDVQVVFLLVILAAFVLLIFLRKRGERVEESFELSELLGYALAVVYLVLLFVFWVDLTNFLGQFLSIPQGSDVPVPPDGGGGNVTALPVSTQAPVALFVYAVGLGGALVAVILLKARRTAPTADIEGGEEARRREMRKAVETTLTHLAVGGDVRAGILRCYQELCVLLGGQGLSDQVSYTAREIEHAALLKLGLSEEGIDRLTRLFELARYSHHSLREEHREEAIRALELVRGELELKE
jgi:hypothetical protein